MSSRIAEELSAQTRDLVARFEERADAFVGRKDLMGLTAQLDPGSASRFIREFLGEGEHTATGIDGSMDFDERLQMMLFYANAAAYSCPFRVGERTEFDLGSARRESSLSASAAIPLWAEDLGAVFSLEPEIDLELEHSMERIPNSFMTLGELYLAARASEGSKVILLDRPMSGTYSTLARDARNLLKQGDSKLVKWSGGKVSMLDIYLGLVLGAPQMPLPNRRRFLATRVLRHLMSGGRTHSELASELNATDAEVARAARWLVGIDKRYGGRLLSDRTPTRLALDEKAAGYWGRISSLALEYSRSVFEARRHPLAVGGDEYLTILDVNTLSLFLLELLHSRARESHVLVIGVAKDTTATDISRAVIPLSSENGFISLVAPPPRLKNDRAFLTILSSENPSLKTPWRTKGYDSALSTIVSIQGKFVGARKTVSRERLFARSFFQLRSLKSDPAIRSQVFLFDRIYDERYDSGSVRKAVVMENGTASEIEPYLEGRELSGLSNASLYLLSLMDNPEVFEAFGHNQLLYLADKAVKAEVRMLRSSLRGVADLRVGGVTRRKKIFGLITTYREQRAEAEQSRMRAGGRTG
ncbi:MAG TPA: hypothetical protein VLY21_05035 [Nitrososphaerales archaeon]|nr:hypothetical protein [Nitrososphaerales archaeon]